jgi:hypothetical protein
LRAEETRNLELPFGESSPFRAGRMSKATFTYNGLLLLEGFLSERFARAAPFVTDIEELD